MKYKRFILIIILNILLLNRVKSQENWNLSRCIHYAIENNIDLNISRNNLLKQEINLYESKADLFPDLNMGSGININYGRNIDGATNDITYKQTVSNNYWINSSFDIFQGLVKQNTIRYNKYLLSANKQEHEIIKNKLIFDVISAYYTLAYSIGLEELAKSQIKISKFQLERIQKMVDVGKESPITVQELKSQWVTDKLNLTKAENQKTSQLLKLKQLLRLNPDTSFSLDTNKLNKIVIRAIPDLDDAFSTAINDMPQIKQQEFLVKAEEKSLAIAKGRVSPRLYMSIGLNSYFFDGSNMAFPSQLKNNQNQYMSFGLMIPIFNNASVHSNIKRKQIDLNNQELEIERQKERILSQIQEIYNNIKSADSEYNSAIESYQFSYLSFRNTSTKLEKGMASTTDFEIAKQRLTAAKVAILKAKLTYIMHSKILEFYKTGNWNHL